ncbi:hypothetical protein [Sphingomonas oryzagri]
MPEDRFGRFDSSVAIGAFLSTALLLAAATLAAVVLFLALRVQ